MFILNSHPDYQRELAAADGVLFGAASARDAERFFAQHPDYRPTPLPTLAALAREAGVGAIDIKDESVRLGLGSFKALGGMYAVARVVLEQAAHALGRQLGPADLHTPAVRAVAAGIVVACATEGNHGRSVAAGARLCGAEARIYVQAGVSAARRDAIERFGATVVTVPGQYDDAVAHVASACASHGWHCVSDTSWSGQETMPGWVMQGYTLLIKEALDQLAEAPTHVFIQAGVGGLAAALAGYLATRFGAARPRLVVVEPARAACLLESLRARRALRIAHGEPTIMSMLACYAPSPLAWRILTHAADAFMTVDEADALAAMRRLARPHANDPALVAGESGGVGLAGLLRAAGDARLRTALGLDARSRVLVINTEGATDPARYEALLASAPASITQGSQ